MKRFVPIVFLVLCFGAISAQSEKFELNDCISPYTFKFYHYQNAKDAKDDHLITIMNEINLLIEDNGFFYFKNNYYNSKEKLVNAIQIDLSNRGKESKKDLVIGLHGAAQFNRLSELICWLENIGRTELNDTVYLYFF